MYSKLRRKLIFTIACLIIPMVIVSIGAQSTRAAWVIGNNANGIYPARPGYTPIFDGVQESSWGSTTTYLENTYPSIEFHMKYNGSMAYCLIIVKNYTHSANESVLLILSNNGTTLTEIKYFIDAKYADINNKTEDRRLVAGNYVADDDQNITGKMSFNFEQDIRNHSVYEFGFKYNNTDPTLDTDWTFGKTYAAKIKVMDEVAGWSFDYPLFGIEFGLIGGEGNDTITPFDLDMQLLTWIAFIIVSGIYGVIGIYVAISRGKLIVIPKERAPEELEEATEPYSDTSEEVQEETEDLEEE